MFSFKILVGELSNDAHNVHVGEIVDAVSNVKFHKSNMINISNLIDPGLY